MPVSFRPAARDDVLRQFLYYLDEVGDPSLAQRFLDAVETATVPLAEQPRIGAPQSLKDPQLRALRAWPIPGFEEIWCYYLEHDDDVEIVRVLHSKRDIISLLKEEPGG